MYRTAIVLQGFQNPLKVVYSHSKTPSTKSSSRYIPQAPDRILDAPDILDDYYLNLVDWNANNILAVALNDALYLWNATTGTIERLFTLEGNDYICSVSWMTDGATHLAVGNSLGSVQLWDCTTMKSVRKMTGHSARVSSLCWNSYVVTSGARSGVINHYDVRQRDYQVATVSGGHTQEVCGLKWSPDGKYLASGGNDNMLCVWPVAGGEKHSQPQPLYSFSVIILCSAHQAAVKALSWCPWQPNILASGGGTADRTIRFWNCNTGVCLNTLDTKSQVCSLQWSSTYKELVSGHGFSNHQITIWRYPALTKVAELTGHTARVLHLAMSPDGSTILSAGADETLRLWKCFLPDPTKKKEPTEVKVENSIFRRGIR
uniref:CDC20/Fizzy WD40 domain-containing protein n=1 Tax=Timema douglasi TaxID=61478 RepID=A0A7R8VCQ1_TIMDO|nr:unnamed protein product [Timema douglasi]